MRSVIFALVLLPFGAAAAELSESTRLRELMARTPTLALRESNLALKPALPIEMVSSVAVAADGLIYILQRGKQSPPVIVAKPDGTVVRSWGKGLYTIPHAIRIDPQGNVWTVDAGDSTIRRFTPYGKETAKLTIELPAKPNGPFCGATDIAFAPNGHIYVSDGYQNTRVIEFDRDLKRLREWGKPGTGQGELDHPHGIAIAKDGTVYVADRENGRIQRFSPDGRFLGLWDHLGKTFSLKLTLKGELWIGTQPRDVPNGAEGWLVKVDPSTGRALGRLDSFGHSIEVTPAGEVFTGRRPDVVVRYVP